MAAQSQAVAWASEALESCRGGSFAGLRNLGQAEALREVLMAQAVKRLVVRVVQEAEVRRSCQTLLEEGVDGLLVVQIPWASEGAQQCS